MSANLFEQIITAVAPLECHICSVEGFMLCLSCRQSELFTPESRCYICNRLTNSNQVCTSCRSSSRLRRVWWLGPYKELFKELVHDLKYKRKRAYGREFGNYLAQSLPYLPEDTIVVPVPTASNRIRIRGYDQAVLIASSFAKKRNFKMKQLLKRTTKYDQIGKKRSERIEQMKHSLGIRSPEKIAGANILLIDDVLTTGATLEAAATVLRQHGAKHVDAAVVARHLI